MPPRWTQSAESGDAGDSSGDDPSRWSLFGGATWVIECHRYQQIVKRAYYQLEHSCQGRARIDPRVENRCTLHRCLTVHRLKVYAICDTVTSLLYCHILHVLGEHIMNCIISAFIVSPADQLTHRWVFGTLQEAFFAAASGDPSTFETCETASACNII